MQTVKALSRETFARRLHFASENLRTPIGREYRPRREPGIALEIYVISCAFAWTIGVLTGILFFN